LQYDLHSNDVTRQSPIVTRRWWPRFRRLIQFNLQSLLVLIVAAAFAFAWWKEHRRYEALSRERNPARASWSVDQVTGPPNTPGAGDLQTAWASASQDGQDEWLLLEYLSRVVPSEVIVHETYNPGALVRVTVFDWWGTEHDLWQGTDPTPTTVRRGISKVKAGAPVTTRWIKIYLDSRTVPGWNEIDAVGIVDGQGNTHWARRAYASSAYGDNREAPRWYRGLGEGK
jgi:hypothetical protein